MEIAELDKPKDQWCPNCEIGSGCRIYASRPESCRAFVCGYLAWEIVPDYWQPSKSKMVIVSEMDGAQIAIHVDASVPGAWLSAKYYDDIKSLAVQAARDDARVIVCVGRRMFAILPDKDVDLGIVSSDDRIVTGQTSDGAWTALKLHKDDPRRSSIEDGKPFFGRVI
jgi:hypothetical protein